MDQGMNIGVTGITTAQTRADLTANNLANVNTPGFKPSSAVNAELSGGGVEISAIGRAMSQGALQPTGNPLDVALSGEGFLVFHGAEGERSFSRNGSLRLDGDGYLVNAQGLRLQGTNGDLRTNGPGGVRIGQDGTVTQTSPDGRTTELGAIAVARFTNPAGLTATGDSLYRESANSGTVALGTAGTGARGTVQSGFLEMSAVNLAKEMVDLMVSEKEMALNVKTIKTKNEMLGEILDLKQ